MRRAAGSEAARLLADLVVEGARTLAFVRSRRGAEVVALTARRHLAAATPDLVDRVAAYRGGYLPEERRVLESALAGGALLGDRIRMESVALDPGVFIRSMATRGSLGGLAEATPGAGGTKPLVTILSSQ